jgi:small subunit ribosomal protein S1
MIPEATTMFEGSEDFASLLDSYDYDQPKRGQILKGVIISVRSDEVILDVGLKRDAIVPRNDLVRLAPHVIAGLAPGAEVHVSVMRPFDTDENLIVSINKALQLEDWTKAEELVESGETFVGEVVDTNSGGLLVRFMRLVGFLPNSHIASIPVGTPLEKLDNEKRGLLGKSLTLKVIQIDPKRNRLILSERAAQRQAKLERLGELAVGTIVEGQVVNLTHFGAFVDIGGVDGMIHISNIDHRHIKHPSDVLSVGDSVSVRIDSIDAENGRIALNRRATLPDPWNEFIQNFKEGDLLSGVVTNVVDFGVFVAAPGGAQGLVHTTRMSSLGTTNPRDMFRSGDPVLARIVTIDTEKQHIELSVDDVAIEEQQGWMYERRSEVLAAQAEFDAQQIEDEVAPVDEVADVAGAPEAEIDEAVIAEGEVEASS